MGFNYLTSCSILATYYKLAPYTNNGFGVPGSLTSPHKFVNGRTAASASTLLQGALEGHVLVKNTKKALPLKNPQYISLFGYDGIAPQRLNPTDAQYGLGTYFTAAKYLHINLVLINPQATKARTSLQVLTYSRVLLVLSLDLFPPLESPSMVICGLAEEAARIRHLMLRIHIKHFLQQLSKMVLSCLGTFNHLFLLWIKLAKFALYLSMPL